MFGKRLVSVVVSCAALTGGSIAVAFAAPSAGAATELIVGSASGCTGTYPTISAANAAASPGDTIKVCAGTYDETVDVTTPNLTFLGAEAGKPGVDLLTAPKSPESVVDDVNGGFVLSSTADDTKIDGFTITGAGSPTVNADGIAAFAGSSGLDAVDNFIYANGNGINMQNPTATSPATITKNFIADNTDEGNVDSNPQTGTGVFISNGPADSTSITDNTFSDDSQTAINFAGATGTPSTGLVVDGNKSVNDSTFVVAINSTNAVIEDNTISVTSTNVPGGNGTGILDFGGNTGLRIADNTMKSVAKVSSAIGLATYAGSASADTTVSDNTISGWDYGAYVSTGYTSADLAGNTVSSNAAGGIDVETGTSGNVISHNTVSKDTGAAKDCIDASTGSGTAGTGNTWLHDIGKNANSSPKAICPS